MSRNIELKLRLPGPEAFARAQASAAVLTTGPVVAVSQVDKYFVPFRKDGVRMKMRLQSTQEGRHDCELIFYSRADAKETRVSRYTRLQATGAFDAAMVEDALGLVDVTVIKFRTVYMYHNVRIHLDWVENAGYFVEFEAVMGGDDDEQRCGHQRIAQLCKDLHLEDADPEARGYREIVMSSQ